MGPFGVRYWFTWKGHCIVSIVDSTEFNQDTSSKCLPNKCLAWGHKHWPVLWAVAVTEWVWDAPGMPLGPHSDWVKATVVVLWAM